jgi:hypothetical protein
VALRAANAKLQTPKEYRIAERHLRALCTSVRAMRLPLAHFLAYEAFSSINHDSRLLFFTLAFSALVVATSIKAAEPDLVFADFEGSDYGAWQVEGDAFGKGPAQGTLPGQMAVSGFVGKGLVNSFAGGDRSTGKLTSPKFRIERKYIGFLIGGGGIRGGRRA